MKRALATYAPYILLTTAIMLPLFTPGYILTLDLVFTPELRMPAEISSDYLWQTLLHLLDRALPSQLIEKIILVSIPLLASIGMHKLLGQLTKSETQWTLPVYAAGIFYAVNPFTYSRFMAGQYAVLLGYALLPWFALFLIRFLASPGYQNLLRVVAAALAISIISVHTIGEAALLTLVITGIAAWQKRSGAGFGKYLKLGTIGLGLFAVLSSYWLVPALIGTGEEGRVVRQFDQSHAEAFATVGGNTATKIFHIMNLQGFWAEGRGLFILPQDKLPGWGTARLIIWVLVGLGLAAIWRRSRSQAVAAVALTLVAATLAAGFPQSLLTSAGYREPHKFAGLVAFSFAILLAFGVQALLGRMQLRSQTHYSVTATAALLSILLFAPTMYWGFSGQLKPRQYPESWEQINSRLNQDRGDFKVLFLPWHQYMSFGFAGRIIGNPAPTYFDKPIVSSHDPELENIRPALSHEERAIAGLLKKPPPDLSQQLSKKDIKYVVLAKDHDYRRYSFLNSGKTLRILTDTSDATLYLNTSYMEDK